MNVLRSCILSYSTRALAHSYSGLFGVRFLPSSPCGSRGADDSIGNLLFVGREPEPTLVSCLALDPLSGWGMLGTG